jgi:hypothetical protein
MDNNNKVQSIFTKNHYINLISCVIIWLGGILLINNHFDEPGLKILFYTAAFCVIIILINRTEKYYKNFLTKNVLFLAMLIITAAVILLYRLGYIGYPSFAGFTILWLSIIYQSQVVKVSLIQLAVFLLSPVLYVEMISFSGSFSLIMLVIVSIFISERFLDNTKLDWKFFLIAFLFGLTLSAHLLVTFIYIIYLLYVFRNNIAKGVIFLLAMLAAYALLSFLADKGYVTIVASTAKIFSTQIPVWIIILLAAITLYMGWIVADLQEVLFTSGLILFFFSVLSFLFRAADFGRSINEIDFSLLIMPIPFLVLSIKEYRVDRFLGKVLY